MAKKTEAEHALYAYWNSGILVRLMRLLHAGVTGTKQELAAMADTSPRNLEAYLPLLHKLGLARIVRWERSETGTAFQGVYGFGEGRKNAPKQTKACRRIRACDVDVSRSAEAKRYLLYIQRGHRTAIEMAEIIGTSTSWARKVMRSLHAQGYVHIAAWEREGAHPPVAVYGPGRGEDAKKPKKLTHAEANARRRRRLDEQYGEEAAKRILTPRSQGGPERIVQDGRTVWARGVNRGIRTAKPKEAVCNL